MPGTPSGHLRRGRPEHAAINAAADVVFPIPMSPVTSRPRAVGDRLPGHVQPDVEGGAGLARRSSPGPTARLRVPSATLRRTSASGVGGDRRRHADVDDDDVGTGVAGEDVDGRPPGTEVRHHLCRHLLGPWRHALGYHAVVPGEHRHGHGLGHRWRTGAGDGAQAGCRSPRRRPSDPRGLVRRSWYCAAVGCRVGVDGSNATAGFGETSVLVMCAFRRRGGYLECDASARSQLGPERRPIAVKPRRVARGHRARHAYASSGIPNARAVPYHDPRRREASPQPRGLDSTQLASDGLGIEPVARRTRDQRVPQTHDPGRPAAQIDPGQKLGQGRHRQPVDRPRAGAAGNGRRAIAPGIRGRARTRRAVPDTPGAW